MNKEMDPFQNHCDKSIRNWLRSEFIVHASRLNAIECYCPPGIALRELRISYAPLTNGTKVENGHRKNSTKEHSYLGIVAFCVAIFGQKRFSAWQNNTATRRYNRIINWVFVSLQVQLHSGFSCADTCNFPSWILRNLLQSLAFSSDNWQHPLPHH